MEGLEEAAISGDGESRFTDFEAGPTRVSPSGACWDLGTAEGQRARRAGRGCPQEAPRHEQGSWTGTGGEDREDWRNRTAECGRGSSVAAPRGWRLAGVDSVMLRSVFWPNIGLLCCAGLPIPD